MFKHSKIWQATFVFLFLNGNTINALTASPRGVVHIERGIDSSILDNVADTSKCEFNGTVTMAGPFSLEEGDKFFNLGSKQLVSYQLMVDHINRFRCGVTLSDGNYAIKLASYDDQSSKIWTSAIATHIVSNNLADILLGGYSSGLTTHIATVANETSNLLLSPGAAVTSVFANRDSVFGTFPPTAKYIVTAVEGLALAGAKTIATIYENDSFTKGVCGAAPELASTHNLGVTSTQMVDKTPDVASLEIVARKLEKENPDIVLTCVFDGGCINWIKAMRNVNWSPKAQVFTICVGLQKFVNEVGTDAEYIFGVSPWDASLNITDEVTGWSARDFADNFRNETADTDVTYHAASAASVISIAVQAMENTKTKDKATLATHIALKSFKTIYGDISFDSNGQSLAPALLIQYDASKTVQTVYPNKVRSGPILYPMPTWNLRDCIRLSPCEKDGDKCDDTGKCVCDNPDYFPVSEGATAMCVPKEELNYIAPGLKIVFNLLVGMLVIMGVGSLAWIHIYKEIPLVKASQPLFLGLIAVGSIISSCAIIFMSVETGYRESVNIGGVDASCMAVNWLYGLGFTITFSALFAKVWRVKKLYAAAKAMKRTQVGVKDVLYIMLFLLVIELGILITFQIVSPHKWEREVVADIGGYSIESVGRCNSETGWSYFIAMIIFNVVCLLYALILCFQAKNIPADFAETGDIFLAVMFMFQVLILAVPVSSMVKDQPNVFFFIRAGAVFLQNFTVLVIIFTPKMRRIYKGEDTRATVMASMKRASSATPSGSA